MKIVLGLFALLLIIVVGSKFAMDYLANNPNPFIKIPTAAINNQTFKLFIAKSAKEKEIGLSGKDSLSQDYAMYFSFEKPDYYSFWMKNMKFPIDMIFLSNNRIVTIYENLEPPSQDLKSPPLYKSNEPADAVLEINAGLTKKYNIKVGDEIKIKK
ncbi:MAG: DUF192 domain-containing protein [bacterium]|nr:DUF192 domain-containing protein [bacterium]